MPVRHPVDAGRGLVRGDDAGAAQLGLDGGPGRVEAGLGAPKAVADRAFRDGQPEQLCRHPRQALEADVMAVVQIKQQRVDPRTERRSRRHARRRLCPVAPFAPATAPAEQFDPRHNRTDHRQVDVIIAMPATLHRARHVGPAVRAGAGNTAFRLVRCRAQWPRNAGSGRTRALWPDGTALAVLPPGAVLRRRRVRVRRRLLRLRFVNRRLELGNPRRQPLDQHRLLD